MMKKIGLILFVALMALPFSSCTQNTSGTTQVPDEVKLKTQIDSVSYALGVNMGAQMHQMGVEEWNYDAFFKAFQDALNDNELQIKAHMVQPILDPYFMELQKAQMEKMNQAAGDPQENLKEGEDFLAKNKKNKKIKITESGLQYEVMEEGDGPKPLATNEVKVHYHGTKIDGTVFDSSVDRGTPATFTLNRVIKGWTEGLQLMSVGSKYKFYIPSDLAYGTNPPPGSGIGQNCVLIFDIELLEILD